MVILLIPVITFGAPDQLEVDASGTVTGLINISNLEQDITFEQDYVLRGSGKQSVQVTVYVYHEETQAYKQLMIINTEYLEQEEEPLIYPRQWKVGASGLIMQTIQLQEGKNRFKLYAQKDQDYEIIDIEITLLKRDWLQAIKDLNINIQQQINRFLPMSN